MFVSSFGISVSVKLKSQCSFIVTVAFMTVLADELQVYLTKNRCEGGLSDLYVNM
jgi:hypothetical protein